MCGIVAQIGGVEIGMDATFQRMTDSLIHRGPDDRGIEWLPADGVALGMRRLSIVDLEGGRQPMWDEERTHAVVFNGEIYNAADLRKELASKGHRFRTDHSDTEAIVHGYEEWGLGILPRLNGMFAFAIWDRPGRRLVVARDRSGEKPLYIGSAASGFVVASELKALLLDPRIGRDVDLVALEQYLAFDFVIAPRTMLKAVQKLPAAHYAILTSQSCQLAPYWCINPGERIGSEDDLTIELDSLLDKAVRSRMVADVPLGLFLSGGLDSTTVGYYMRKYTDDLHSFSIGFAESEFDESAYASLAAKALGTNHHVERLTGDRMLELVPRIAEVLDEPMADQSIFPTFLLSSFARKTVKVALGGDGSDELLMGYRTYWVTSLAEKLQIMPDSLLRAVAGLAHHLPTNPGLRIRGKRFAELLDKAPAERLLCLLGAYMGNSRWVMSPDARETLPRNVFSEPVESFGSGLPPEVAPAGRTMAGYMRGYLPEDILVKVDRASMAASLEVRAPFLDPSVVDFLASLHPSLKLRGRNGKYLLKQLMSGRIPKEIIERKKHGFGAPMGLWLRTSLAPLVREYLGVERVARAGFFSAPAVTQLVDEHLSGRADHGKELWPLLLFELWRERWLAPRQ